MCNTETATTNKLHPFESAGLGTAPFRYIGFERKVGPIDLGNGFSAGAPGQPMGTCDYCLNGIANCYRIKSSDGKTFVVGCDCVEKLYNPTNKPASKLAHDKVYQSIQAAKRKLAREARHAREAARIADNTAWAEANRPRLQAIAAKREGETLWDTYEWYMKNAGNKGKLEIVKYLRKVLEA